ncbi:murein hydrolase activator EnvC family protein [Streptomyces longispororuber]|uniref:murein hydrolase activator EnvC family protein n=1 Tax=Streptomyces longispororuber TaxID=68230 RepID=UPI00210A624F|nr:peptidoglycan DD-metalloendopeptidase family protein [Streptomyces longispororuber]MCQ4208046.1 peptidoglycan DD-metalloendopeptidase family protein [Streptomyces longispororuber]
MRWVGRVGSAAALLTAVVAGAVPGHAADGPPGGDRAAAAARAERLMRDAARAVEAYEQARAAVESGARELARTGRREAAEQRRLDGLLRALGQQARAEYRSGGGGLWGPVLPLITSRSPERALDGAVRARRGDRAAGQLTDRVRQARDRIAADRATAARLLGAQRVQATRRATARAQIEARLDEAQAELRRAQVPQAVPASRGDCAQGDVAGLGTATDRTWVAPVDPAPLSAGFGAGGDRWAHRHTGQDFAVDTGTTVRAVGAGTVLFVGCGDGFGNQVVVRHPNGYCTQYAHLSLIGVSPGDEVAAGTALGLSGATGNVSGPHLHFEVRVTPQLGSGIDPMPWLHVRGVHV